MLQLILRDIRASVAKDRLNIAYEAWPLLLQRCAGRTALPNLVRVDMKKDDTAQAQRSCDVSDESSSKLLGARLRAIPGLPIGAAHSLPAYRLDRLHCDMMRLEARRHL